MADYNPPTEDLPIFDKAVFVQDDTALTQGQADKRYLRFPNAQGTENLLDITVNGSASFNSTSAPTSLQTLLPTTDNTTKIPTTQWVQSVISSSSSSTTNPNFYFVSKTGSDITNNGSQQKPFLTIQKAIDTAILAGYGTTKLNSAFVFISPDGTYSESLSITKSINLIGLNSSIYGTPSNFTTSIVKPIISSFSTASPIINFLPTYDDAVLCLSMLSLQASGSSFIISSIGPFYSNISINECSLTNFNPNSSQIRYYTNANTISQSYLLIQNSFISIGNSSSVFSSIDLAGSGVVASNGLGTSLNIDSSEIRLSGSGYNISEGVIKTCSSMTVNKSSLSFLDNDNTQILMINNAFSNTGPTITFSNSEIITTTQAKLATYNFILLPAVATYGVTFEAYESVFYFQPAVSTFFIKNDNTLAVTYLLVGCTLKSITSTAVRPFFGGTGPFVASGFTAYSMSDSLTPAGLALTTGTMGNQTFTVKTNNTSQLTIDGSGNVAFLSAIPPTSSAVQPTPSDSSSIMPTTAWVQSAITLGSGKTYTVAYTTTQSITIPSGIMGISVRCVGSGGPSGDAIDINAGRWNSGGSGGGGATVFSDGIIPFITGNVLQVTVTTTYTELANTSLSASVCRADAGGAGGNATPSAGGTAGAGATAYTANTTFCSWTSKIGGTGLVGVTSAPNGSITGLPATGGVPLGVPFLDTNYGCGQRWNGNITANSYQAPTIPLATGVCYITYYSI
jgi:hypothetical protein